MSEALGPTDWPRYLSLWEALPADQRRVAELVGVSERFLARAAHGRMGQDARAIAVHRR